MAHLETIYSLIVIIFQEMADLKRLVGCGARSWTLFELSRFKDDLLACMSILRARLSFIRYLFIGSHR